MDYLPLYHRLRDRPCLVVGGGEVAARKVRWLVKVGAKVRVVAPQLGAELTQALEASTILHEARSFQHSDVADAALVVAATNDRTVNAAVAAKAGERNIPVNVVDDGELSTAIFPSIIDRHPVLVSISTGGRSPTLARALRSRIEMLLPQTLGVFAERLQQLRNRFNAEGKAVSRSFWERLVAMGPERLAELDSMTPDSAPTLGWVAIVGAGPGDPELITLKAVQLLQQADVVMYDNLVNRAILDYARRDAEMIYVGKKRAFKGTRQEDINQLLQQHATEGRNVVRLKGGDPFVFGRGGEELASLAGMGVQCIVVPGITAALGAASYAGIPLTYRNLSQSVRFVTGHRARGSIQLDWSDLAKPHQTLVFYMGLFNLSEISAQLIQAGLPPATPSALVVNATLPEQEVLTGTIESIPTLAETVSGPATVIVGEVVAHRQP